MVKKEATNILVAEQGEAEWPYCSLLDAQGMQDSSPTPCDGRPPTLQKKYTSVMIRVCHSRSRFLSCMYIHDDFMTESR